MAVPADLKRTEPERHVLSTTPVDAAPPAASGVWTCAYSGHIDATFSNKWKESFKLYFWGNKIGNSSGKIMQLIELMGVNKLTHRRQSNFVA